MAWEGENSFCLVGSFVEWGAPRRGKKKGRGLEGPVLENFPQRHDLVFVSLCFLETLIVTKEFGTGKRERVKGLGDPCQGSHNSEHDEKGI